MFSLSGDVVIQTLGAIVIAGIGAVSAIAAARWSKRAEQQMLPNGGSSFRDVVERRLLTHDERLERMEIAGVRRDEQLAEISAVLHAIHARQTGQDGQ